MENKNELVSFSNVFKFAGAFIAFLIGSGFATGQEILQYFTSYGLHGLLTAFIMLVLFFYVGASFISAGYTNKFVKNNDIFTYYCGKYIGAAYDYFTVVFLFMSYVVMIGGASATLNQHYGLNPLVGGILMAVLATCTVVMGLGKIVDIIGRIGPAIVIVSIVIGLVAIFDNPSGILEGARMIAKGEVEVMRAGTNWFTSACSYVGFCMLWLICFLGAMGKQANSKKEAVMGTSFGAAGFALGCVILMLGLLANIGIVAGTQIPSLMLVNKFSTYFATMFTVIIMLGIYTTAVPLLWQVSARFTEEKTQKFRIFTVILAAAGCFIGLELPFNKLVNIIYGINGYVGILLLVFIVLKDIRNHIGK
ncbi:MAG: hypothetical protein RRZ70_05055 [Synergistaceae bacterium]